MSHLLSVRSLGDILDEPEPADLSLKAGGCPVIAYSNSNTQGIICKNEVPPERWQGSRADG
jgi:hypothetical protein